LSRRKPQESERFKRATDISSDESLQKSVYCNNSFRAEPDITEPTGFDGIDKLDNTGAIDAETSPGTATT
jgi:hypothetical protein